MAIAWHWKSLIQSADDMIMVSHTHRDTEKKSILNSQLLTVLHIDGSSIALPSLMMAIDENGNDIRTFKHILAHANTKTPCD